IGVPSNLYALYHAAVQLRQKNELGVYLMNLTVSDLLYLAFAAAVAAGDDWRHREWLCQLCGFLLYENIYISIGFLCCVSLDRYLAVVHPLKFTPLRSMSAAWLISCAIWLKEMAVGIVFFRHKELSRTRRNRSVCFEHYPMQPWEYPINYYRFVIGFIFPLIILTTASTRSDWGALRPLKAPEGPLGFQSMGSALVQPHLSVQISYLCVLRAVGRSAGTQPDQKVRIRQLVSSTILIFLICFSPYHLILLIRTLLERDCAFIAGVSPSRAIGSGMWRCPPVVLLCSRNIQLLPPVAAADQPQLLGRPGSLLLRERERRPRTPQSRVPTRRQDAVLLPSPRQRGLGQPRDRVPRSGHRGEQRPPDCDSRSRRSGTSNRTRFRERPSCFQRAMERRRRWGNSS
ncbi:unnamed protein product, partial [Tetraodon nigroviridis]